MNSPSTKLLRHSLWFCAFCAAFAWQNGVPQLSLTEKDVQGLVERGISAGPNLAVPYLPRPAVAAYKGLDDAAKVKAIQELITLGKAFVSSEAFLKSKDEEIFRGYGGKNYGLKVVSQDQLMKLPPAAMDKAMKSMQYGGLVHQAYRGDVAGLRRNLESDLRGAEYMAKESADMKPDPKRTVQLLKAALAIPNTDESGFRKAAATAKLAMVVDGPLTGIDVEKLAQEEAQRKYDQYSPKGKIRAGLEAFLATAAKVNFAAATAPKGNKVVFTDPAMERAPAATKFLYRLGKAPTTAAVAAAKAWLAELR